MPDNIYCYPNSEILKNKHSKVSTFKTIKKAAQQQTHYNCEYSCTFF